MNLNKYKKIILFSIFIVIILPIFILIISSDETKKFFYKSIKKLNIKKYILIDSYNRERIIKEIKEFNIPKYPGAYSIKEYNIGISHKICEYKINNFYPDKNVIEFYNQYLLNNGWKIINKYENSWIPYGCVMKGKEQSLIGYRRLWCGKYKEKIFYLDITYNTPIGIIEDNLSKWKKEWLSIQNIFIEIQDYNNSLKIR